MALAVAEEMKKIYKKELEPEPIPLFVPGEPVPEEDVSLYLIYSTWFEPFASCGCYLIQNKKLIMVNCTRDIFWKWAMEMMMKWMRKIKLKIVMLKMR